MQRYWRSTAHAALAGASLLACEMRTGPEVSVTASGSGSGTGGAGGVGEGGNGGGTTMGVGGGGTTPQIEGCKTPAPLELFAPDAYFAEGELSTQAHSYYALPVVANELESIYVMPHPAVSNPIDLVLRIWSADGSTLLATGSAEWPFSGNGFDLDLITRFAENGFVCGEVFSSAEWQGRKPEAGPNSHHGLVIGPTETYYENDYVVFEAEPNDPSDPRDITLDAFLALPIYGTFSSDNDADAFAFEATNSSITVLFMPTRPPTEDADGWGHDAVLPTVSILDATDSVILRRSGADALQTCERGNYCAIHMPAIPGATYQVVVEPPPGVLPDAFYGVWLASAAPPALVAEAPDDILGGTNDGYATAAPVGDGVPGRDVVEYLFEGELHAGDEDWWFLESGPGDVSGDCRSLTYGSGIIGLTVEGRNEAAPDGPALVTVTEATTDPARWGSGTQVPALDGPGGHFIRITASALDPVVEGRRYRCRLVR